jgi:hypothetical protein
MTTASIGAGGACGPAPPLTAPAWDDCEGSCDGGLGVRGRGAALEAARCKTTGLFAAVGIAEAGFTIVDRPVTARSKRL